MKRGKEHVFQLYVQQLYSWNVWLTHALTNAPQGMILQLFGMAVMCDLPSVHSLKETCSSEVE